MISFFNQILQIPISLTTITPKAAPAKGRIKSQRRLHVQVPIIWKMDTQQGVLPPCPFAQQLWNTDRHEFVTIPAEPIPIQASNAGNTTTIINVNRKAPDTLATR